jgi:hypothetical protein
MLLFLAICPLAGKRNGQYRHCERTKAEEQRKFSALLKLLRSDLT